MKPTTSIPTVLAITSLLATNPQCYGNTFYTSTTNYAAIASAIIDGVSLVLSTTMGAAHVRMELGRYEYNTRSEYRHVKTNRIWRMEIEKNGNIKYTQSEVMTTPENTESSQNNDPFSAGKWGDIPMSVRKYSCVRQQDGVTFSESVSAKMTWRVFHTLQKHGTPQSTTTGAYITYTNWDIESSSCTDTESGRVHVFSQLIAVNGESNFTIPQDHKAVNLTQGDNAGWGITVQ